MPATTSNVTALVNHLVDHNPSVVQLGKVVSLAARIEPELLRAARLMLTPMPDVSAEADLWFSPLVESRTADWLVLEPGVAQELRRRLSTNERLMSDARDLISTAHSGAPVTIILEEDILWLATQASDDAQREIEKRLRLVLFKLLEDTTAHRGLARWFAGASMRLPDEARKTEAYAILTFVTSALLDGRRIDELTLIQPSLISTLANFLPASVPKIRIWVALTTRGITFRPDHANGFLALDLPRTDPLLVRVRESNGFSVIVTLRRNETQTVRVRPGIVELQTASGDSYRLRPEITYHQSIIAELPEYRFPKVSLDKIEINQSFKIAPYEHSSTHRSFEHSFLGPKTISALTLSNETGIYDEMFVPPRIV